MQTNATQLRTSLLNTLPSRLAGAITQAFHTVIPNALVKQSVGLQTYMTSLGERAREVGVGIAQYLTDKNHNPNGDQDNQQRLELAVRLQKALPTPPAAQPAVTPSVANPVITDLPTAQRSVTPPTVAPISIPLVGLSQNISAGPVSPPPVVVAPTPSPVYERESVGGKCINIISEQLQIGPEECFADAYLVQDLNRSSMLRCLGGDSLDLVEIVMELEDEFKISVPDEDYEKLKTVGDVIQYVEKVLEAKKQAQ